MCTGVYFLPENTAMHHTLKCYVHASLIIIKKYYRAPNLKMLCARRPVYTRKYCRTPYLKALKCYVYDSLFLPENTIVHYTLKRNVHVSLIFTRKCVHHILKRHSGARQYFKMLISGI